MHRPTCLSIRIITEEQATTWIPERERISQTTLLDELFGACQEMYRYRFLPIIPIPRVADY